MIISQHYRYVFVEVPNTGCTAVAKALVEQCGGQKILTKHATYGEFLRFASADEKKYYVFGSVRNPLDAIVSVYWKLKHNHKGAFTRSGPRPWWSNSNVLRQQFEFIHHNDADFRSYFFQFVRKVYNNNYLLLHERFNRIMRFETLSINFMETLREIGVANVVDLPHVNRTEGKSDFLNSYSPDMYRQAARCFGPYMRKWGYAFPNEWGDVSIPNLSHIRFATMDRMGSLAAKRLSVGPNSHGRLLGLIRKGIRRIWA